MDRRTGKARMAKKYRWYVLRVRHESEGLVISGLRTLGIEVFLPSKSSHFSRESEDSHIFARFSLANQRDVSLVPGVLCLVGVPSPVPVPDRDVAKLKAATEAGMRMKILPMVDEPVRGRISKGPLSGYDGNFIKHRGMWNLVVRIEGLECTLAFPLPQSSLDVLPKDMHRT
jgi:hypothetical protein